MRKNFPGSNATRGLKKSLFPYIHIDKIFQFLGGSLRIYLYISPRKLITHSLAMSWEAKARFLGLSWEMVSRTSSGEFLRVESCYPESFVFLRLCIRSAQIISNWLKLRSDLLRKVKLIKAFNRFAAEIISKSPWSWRSRSTDSSAWSALGRVGSRWLFRRLLLCHGGTLLLLHVHVVSLHVHVVVHPHLDIEFWRYFRL